MSHYNAYKVEGSMLILTARGRNSLRRKIESYDPSTGIFTLKGESLWQKMRRLILAVMKR